MTIVTMMWLLTLVGASLQLRGGRFHGHLVERAAQSFVHKEFKVHFEQPCRLPDGRVDFVDLVATRDVLTIACEVETTLRYLRVNLANSVVLGLPTFVVFPTRRLRASGRRIAQGILGAGKSNSFWFLLPDELPQALATYFPCFPPGECRSGNGKTSSSKAG